MRSAGLSVPTAMRGRGAPSRSWPAQGTRDLQWGEMGSWAPRRCQIRNTTCCMLWSAPLSGVSALASAQWLARPECVEAKSGAVHKQAIETPSINAL